MTTLHAIAIALSATTAIGSKASGKRRTFLVFKPLTMLLILTLALEGPVSFSAPFRSWIVAGLLLCLLGDVLLMLEDRYFLAGLVGFLAGHLAYIAAFRSVGGFHRDLLALLPGAVIGAVLMLRLWPDLGRMRMPVALYTAVIVTMFWQAFGLWRADTSQASLMAALGAGLFVVSDAALALDRFGRPFKAAPALVLGTYYLAQTLIALSA